MAHSHMIRWGFWAGVCLLVPKNSAGRVWEFMSHIGEIVAVARLLLLSHKNSPSRFHFRLSQRKLNVINCRPTLHEIKMCIVLDRDHSFRVCITERRTLALKTINPSLLCVWESVRQVRFLWFSTLTYPILGRTNTDAFDACAFNPNRKLRTSTLTQREQKNKGGKIVNLNIMHTFVAICTANKISIKSKHNRCKKHFI